MPKVSVIIPVYNAEKYLRQCLDSLIIQTLKDIEIVCVDDGSTDSSLDILQEYALKDIRIRILEQTNKGPSIARQNGINIANGQYIGFIDSDDFVSKNYYETLYKKAIKYNADISMTDKVLLYDKQNITKKYCGVSPNSKIIKSRYDKGNIIITTGICCNKIYKKEFINNNNLFPMGSYPGADNIFNATTIIKSNKIVVNHVAKYYYVQISDSIVHKLKTKKSFNIINNYRYIDEWITKQDDLSEEDKKYWKYVNNRRKYNDFKEFLRTMSEDCKEEFKSIINDELKVTDLIISLTSYPARINSIHITIESLLNQTLKAEKIILWLAEEQFPNKEKDLPEQLLALVPKGLTIEWCKDIKSYKKLIPALKKYPNKVIITADDDIIYEPNRVEVLYDSHIKNPFDVICHRGHYILKENSQKIKKYLNWIHCYYLPIVSNNILPTGCGMVLYPLDCFYKDILNENLYTELCNDTDDIWFWAMAILNGTKVRIAKNHISNLDYVPESQNVGLCYSNVDNEGNDKNLQLMFKHYPCLLKCLSTRKPGKFYHKIFSIANINNHKVICILGLKVKLKRRNK